MILKSKKNKDGYALLEMVFYISIFAVVSVLVINSLIVMMKSFKEARIMSELRESSKIMEKISRTVREADSIYSVGNNNMALNSKDSTGADKRTSFILNTDNNIEYYEVVGGNIIKSDILNTPNISIESLSFSQITTAKGTAVKIFLAVSSNHDSQSRVENFYDTVVLRGDY